MRHRFLPFASLFALAFVAGLWLGCSPDFNLDEDTEPEDFPCEEDDDCVDPYRCDPEQFHCTHPSNLVECEGDEDCDGDQVCRNNECEDPPPPEFCDMEDENYPPEQPLDIPEACDGTDTNCDGEIDGMACDTDDDCPDEGYDIYGTRLDVDCDTDLGVCVASHPFNKIDCSGYQCLPAGDCPEDAEGCFEPLHDDPGCPDGSSPPDDNGDDDNGDDDNGDDDNGDNGDNGDD